MIKEPAIIAIVPVCNEEKNLPHILEELLNCGIKLDVLVVNDGSIDNSSKIARAFPVIVIDLPVNSGIFIAVQTGFKYAFKHHYDIAVQVDADGQHDPKEIPLLIKPIIESDIDLAVGSRYLGRTEYHVSFIRDIGIRVFGLITSLFMGQKITDTTCGFRAYGSSAIKFFATESSFEFRDATGLVVLHRLGLSITEVPIVLRKRITGHSSIGILLTLIYPFYYLLSLMVVMLRQPTRKE